MRSSIFTIIISFILGLFLAVAPALAVDSSLPAIDNPFDSLQVKIPGMQRFSDAALSRSGANISFSTNWIGEYDMGVYNFGIAIIGILAVLAIAIGGVMWIMSFGNPGRVGEAKEWITGAILGLVLALGSYILLNTINADLVRMRPIQLGYVPPKTETIDGISITEGGSDSTAGIGGTVRDCADEATLIDLNKTNTHCDIFTASDPRITPRLAAELTKVCDTAHQLGVQQVEINSAFRTMEHQRRLYEDSGRNSRKVAPPTCNAPHVAGVAIDAYAYPRSATGQETLKRAFQANGWQRYCAEAWHFQPSYDPPGNACSP